MDAARKTAPEAKRYPSSPLQTRGQPRLKRRVTPRVNPSRSPSGSSSRRWDVGIKARKLLTAEHRLFNVAEIRNAGCAVAILTNRFGRLIRAFATALSWRLTSIGSARTLAKHVRIILPSARSDDVLTTRPGPESLAQANTEELLCENCLCYSPYAGLPCSHSLKLTLRPTKRRHLRYSASLGRKVLCPINLSPDGQAPT